MYFSVLDRAATSSAETEAETLRGVADHARHVERLGFRRFLVAEHHGVPGIPAGQPAQLATFVASQTSRIRVGTGGIMVPNHPPFLIAEQIGLLNALFPDRIDIGLGSSVGFTKPVRAALRQGEPAEVKARYDADLGELLSYLRGEAAVTARPSGAGVPLFVLAGYRSALSAAKLGLGVILGGPVDIQVKVAEAYRRAFVPSSDASEPHIISSLNIAVADSEEEARQLLVPEAFAQSVSQSTGIFRPLSAEPDVDALTTQQRGRMEQILANGVVGTPEQVGERLASIARMLGVDEFLVTGDMPNREGRARSEELLSAHVG